MNRSIQQLAHILNVKPQALSYYFGQKKGAPKPTDILIKRRQRVRVWEEKMAIKWYQQCKKESAICRAKSQIKRWASR